MSKAELRKEDYPLFLSMKEADNYPTFKTFWDSDSYQRDFKKAKAYAKRIKGELYTATDEENKTIYIKGLHFVNRFGFIVIKKGVVKNLR